MRFRLIEDSNPWGDIEPIKRAMIKPLIQQLLFLQDELNKAQVKIKRHGTTQGKETSPEV